MPHLSCFFFLSAVTQSCHRAKCQSPAGASPCETPAPPPGNSPAPLSCNSPAPSPCNSPTVVAVQFACPVAVQFACPVAMHFAYCRRCAFRLRPGRCPVWRTPCRAFAISKTNQVFLSASSPNIWFVFDMAQCLRTL